MISIRNSPAALSRKESLLGINRQWPPYLGVVFNFEIIWKKHSCVFVQRGFSAFRAPKGANGQKKVKNGSKGGERWRSQGCLHSLAHHWAPAIYVKGSARH